MNKRRGSFQKFKRRNGVVPWSDCDRGLQPALEAEEKQTACLSPQGEFAVCPKQEMLAVSEGTGTERPTPFRRETSTKEKNGGIPNKRMIAILGAAIILWTTLGGQVAWGEGPQVRVKDIAHILEARENQLMGFGLVVGLRRTGDSTRTALTREALSNLIQRMGITVPPQEFKSRNVAAVMVTANLPPFLKPGQRIDVLVSSIGDATSLKGGTLLSTPLEGANGGVYAVAQGALLVGGLYEDAWSASVAKNLPTVGRIPRGALIEKEVSVSIRDIGFLTIVLNEPDFTTASNLVYSLKESGLPDARAVDAATVKVPLREKDRNRIVELIADIENLTLVPDTIAKVVINERTGTVVIGENVRLAPVAVTHGNINVRIEEEGIFFPSKIEVQEEKGRLVTLNGDNLGNLVKALNALGVTPRDLIAILQAVKSAGALSAELEII